MSDDDDNSIDIEPFMELIDNPIGDYLIREYRELIPLLKADELRPGTFRFVVEKQKLHPLHHAAKRYIVSRRAHKEYGHPMPYGLDYTTGRF